MTQAPLARFGVLAALSLMALSACSGGGGGGNDAAIAEAFEFYERQGDWVISCTRGPSQGTASECRLGRMSGPEDRQGVDNTLLLRASATGVAVEDPGSRFAADCGVTPVAHRVDDAPLSGLATDQRVALLSAGTAYYRETLTRTPDCQLAEGRTDLDGFPAAYARFLEVAAIYGFAGTEG
jgi:hypothetical protein